MQKTFKKSEKLCQVPLIDRVFRNGRNEFSHPFKLLYIPAKADFDSKPQVLISVPRRNFKKAVDRNRIKRQIRELYRHNKSFLMNKEGKFPIQYLAILFIAKEKMPYTLMQEKIQRLFTQLSE